MYAARRKRCVYLIVYCCSFHVYMNTVKVMVVCAVHNVCLNLNVCELCIVCTQLERFWIYVICFCSSLGIAKNSFHSSFFFVYYSLYLHFTIFMLLLLFCHFSLCERMRIKIRCELRWRWSHRYTFASLLHIEINTSISDACKLKRPCVCLCTFDYTHSLWMALSMCMH